MNSSAKGNAKERRTAALLAEDGWVIASRRHIGGCGDLLAVRTGEIPRLIEVKASATPWMNFRRPDRIAMRAYAAVNRLDAQLAWWAPRAKTPVYFGTDQWPIGG